jgi:hypothetical protein
MVGADTENLLAKISLNDDDGYTDVTQLLFSKTQKLKHGIVVKSPSFSLFEGTHALEILNHQLDSGLIVLTEEELTFDVVKPRSLDEICWLTDSLFRSLFTWLNNSTLPQTLFSNRYVEELLVNYTKFPQNGLTSCVFSTQFSPNDAEDQLVHLVLRNVILGCLYFARVGCTLVQGGTVYEEEDINSQAMNLNIISNIQLDEVLEQLEITLEYLNSNFKDNKSSSIIQNVINIVQDLLKLPLFLNTRIPPQSENIKYDVSFLDSTLKKLDYLQENALYLKSLQEIPGCYSRGIQKRLNNNAPPKKLVPYEEEDFSSVRLLINDFKQIFSIMDRETSNDVVSHSLNFANTDHHAISRAFYPLFLVRDDRSVLGNETLIEFLVSQLSQFSCYNAEIFSTDNHIVQKKVMDFLQQLSLQVFELLNVTNQNPCRQRQHLSRLIIQFDSLQANAENLEVNFSEVFQIKDEFFESENDKNPSLAIPLTSWLYFIKLEIMISVVLRGFELDLYKLWEFHPMYWYASYLVGSLLTLLNRVLTYNNYKIESIKNMGKRVKKKKGDQRQKYKEKYEHKLKNEVPALKVIISHIEEKILSYRVIQNLVQLEILNILNLKEKGFIKTPDFPFAPNKEMLFNLRMKSFSTVGIPQFPTYDQYIKQLKHTEAMSVDENKTKELRSKVIQDCKEIISRIESASSFDYNINRDSWVSWFKEYQKSCIGIGLNAPRNQQPESTKVIVEKEGFHRYFPVIKLVNV